MIYLRHAVATSGLATPRTVTVVADDVEWLVTQVRTEMEALFPDARVEVGTTAAATDLLVVVYPAGSDPEDRLRALGSRAGDARLGIALYCVDDRHFEVVRAADVDRWLREQRRRRRMLHLSRRLSPVWNRLVRRLVAP